MKAMFIAFAAIIVIAIGANFVLNQLDFASSDRAAGDSVRLGDAEE